MGVEWFGMVMGLGFVLSFGYWCTDFLVVQRAMAAESMSAARRTPLIAAVPKMLFPLLVILPGMIAIALHTAGARGFTAAQGRRHARLQHGHAADAHALLSHRPAGAGPDGADGLVHVRHGRQRHRLQHRVDLRHLPGLHPARTDRPRTTSGWATLATVVGILLSVAAAYAATQFNNIMDMLQLVFAFVNAPLFATFLLGMFWRRTTGHGAFFGLLSAPLAAAVAPRPDPADRAPWPASRAAGSAPSCTSTRARWPRTSGRPSGPGPPASWPRS